MKRTSGTREMRGRLIAGKEIFSAPLRADWLIRRRLEIDEKNDESARRSDQPDDSPAIQRGENT
jgi:hypothetical protein